MGHLLSFRTKTPSRPNGEQKEAQKTICSSTNLLAGSGLTCCSALPLPLPIPSLFDRDFSRSNALHRGPDDGQATHLGGKDVNLIGALPHIAEETLDGISR
jgi:hypothetical protein